ncbi:MAG: hypothetical protein AAF721_02825 [Myxococcota bacterium]
MMNALLKPTLFALGVFAWSTAAHADNTPDCGGDGQAACAAKPARSHGKASNVGCPSGSFFDPRRGGECWTCNGKTRTVHAVTSASACGSHIFDGGGVRAKFVRTVWGCGAGQFFDLTNGGSCWSCPSGRFRGVAHVKSASACLVAPGNVCDAGMERSGASCQPSNEHQARQAAKAVMSKYSAEILRVILLGTGLAADGSLTTLLGDKDPAAIRAVMATGALRKARVRSPVFETITIGAATSAGLVAIAGSAETGIAIDVRAERPVQWYGSTAYQVGPALSAEAGLTVGLWRAESNALAGDAQGVVLGASDLAQLGTLLSDGLDFDLGASVSVSIWFSYPDDRGEIELQGIVVTPGVGVGANLGGYVRGTTVQSP